MLVYLAFTLLLLRQSARNRIDEPIWFIVLLFVFAAAILLFGRGGGGVVGGVTEARMPEEAHYLCSALPARAS